MGQRVRRGGGRGRGRRVRSFQTRNDIFSKNSQKMSAILAPYRDIAARISTQYDKAKASGDLFAYDSTVDHVDEDGVRVRCLPCLSSRFPPTSSRYPQTNSSLCTFLLPDATLLERSHISLRSVSALRLRQSTTLRSQLAPAATTTTSDPTQRPSGPSPTTRSMVRTRATCSSERSARRKAKRRWLRSSTSSRSFLVRLRTPLSPVF